MKTDKISSRTFKPPRLKMTFRLFLYFITIIFGTLSVVESVGQYFYDAVDIGIYVIAACGVVISCYYLGYDLFYGVRPKIRAAIEKNSITNRIYQDYHYRTFLFTLCAFLINIFYAVSNGIYGIINRSAWLGTFAAYYMFLSMMRFFVVWQGKKLLKSKGHKNRHAEEWTVYGRCGILLILITVALSGAVILLVNKEGGVSYPGILIFAAAAYTFYKVIISIVNMVKAKKMNSPLLVTIRNIGYADALVSVLSLQTAMFLSFGEGENIDTQMMNAVTGAVICVMIFLIGIYMTGTARKHMNNLQQDT